MELFIKQTNKLQGLECSLQYHIAYLSLLVQLLKHCAFLIKEECMVVNFNFVFCIFFL